MRKILALCRLLAAVPLLAIAVQHLTGTAPMLHILKGAKLPLPELTARVAPIVEVVAGASLLTGFFARLGALLAIGSMVGAVVAHTRFDWADEPPIVLPAAILVLSLLVLAKGAGAFAFGRK